eukprot:GILK01007245.1.p1 GENE.GILK01007245.1~~GILK01007245.1.p1  ORF type:complete len:130 (-),score=3.31 GILK01007245.1:28-417(-)
MLARVCSAASLSRVSCRIRNKSSAAKTKTVDAEEQSTSVETPAFVPVPIIPTTEPLKVEGLRAGKKYYWCTCGLSMKQPFCDNSHKGTAFKPRAFILKDTPTEPIMFCGCKQTKHAPFCDDSHLALETK